MPLFDGLGVIVDGWLGIDEKWKGSAAPRYANKSSLDRLIKDNVLHSEGETLVHKLYEQLDLNWDQQAARGNLNWFYRQKLHLSENATSPEVTLNRTFMQVVADENWANEVPVASGVADTSSDSVDFVLKSDDHDEYSMIELKWPRENSQSPTPTQMPLGAAVQVLRYGLAYVFSRVNAEKLGYLPTDQPILSTSQVHLRVLAPKHFYAPFLTENGWLKKLESAFDKGVKDLASTKCEGLQMSFAFEQFPEGFTWDPADRREDAKRNTVADAFEKRIRTF